MFEITIKEIKTETKTVRGEYQEIGRHLITDKELEGSAYHGRADREKAIMGGEPVFISEYGYTPDYEKDVESEHQIYTQRVEKLELANVIKAINGI